MIFHKACYDSYSIIFISAPLIQKYSDSSFLNIPCHNHFGPSPCVTCKMCCLWLLHMILALISPGVIFVHDLSQRRTKTSLQKWASEIAATGTFSAPLSSGGPGGLPVPYIVIGNKSDVAAKEGTRGSSGNLVDAARQWVEKQGLLPSSEEIPLTESFPGSGGLIAVSISP
jgi:hypothetical protein